MGKRTVDGDKVIDRLLIKLANLERENAFLFAENTELRKELAGKEGD